jgi:hypothetical protein
MDENLIGYLLNSLDPDAYRQVDEYLRAHPGAAAKVERLRHALAPLADAEQPAPPPGLVVGTLARIAEYQCRPPLPPIPKPKPSDPEPSDWRLPRRMDFLVAASLLLVVGGLVTAWVSRQQHHAKVNACQNNLRLWWVALEQYSGQNNHSFPRVEAEKSRSFAGVFVPILQDAHLVTPEMSVTCPGSGPFQEVPLYSTPQIAAAYQSNPQGYIAMLPTVGGSYAYSLGYIENGKLKSLRDDDGDLLPIMADRPPRGLSGNSPNHGGYGQNVLYIGGNVSWCTGRNVGVELDDIYLNKSGRLQAGEGRNDTVLGPSEASPYTRHDSWARVD